MKETDVFSLVTKSAEDYDIHDAPDGTNLIRIPAFAFLYLLGNAEKHGYKAIV